MNKVRGFTLLELMVTVVVIAIVAIIAVPNMMSMVQRERLTAATNNFVILLNYARSEAIKGGTTVAPITVASLSGTSDWSSGATVKDANNNTLRRMDALPNTFTLNSVTGAGINQLQYNATGFSAVAGNQDFYLCNTNTGQIGEKITVSTTGHVATSPIAANSGDCP